MMRMCADQTAVTPSISPEPARQLARLLHILVRGEKIANGCAHWQAATTTDARARRFFRSQARQEHFHAQLFKGAALWLAPKVSPDECRSAALDSYQNRLGAAMSEHRWTEVLIGQQIVLENLGEFVLTRLDAEIGRRGLGFERLRRTVLRQEQAHHAFGLRLIRAELKGQRSNSAGLDILAGGYAELADDVLVEVSPLLEDLDEDADIYRREVREGLPHWISGISR